MSNTIYPDRPEIAAQSHLTKARHQAMTAEAREHPGEFWAKQARRLDWITAPTKAQTGDFTGDVHVRWFEDGILNASAN